MTQEFKINRDTALSEFERFAELMCIEIDKKNMKPDDSDSFDEMKEIVIRAIMRGDLIINDSGEPTYTPARSDDKTPLTFYEPTGATLAAGDKRGSHQLTSRMYEILGSLTKTHASRFAKMKTNPDLKVCQALVVFFLA